MNVKKLIIAITFFAPVIVGVKCISNEIMGVKRQCLYETQLGKIHVQEEVPLRAIRFYVIKDGKIEYGYSAEWGIAAGTNVELTAISRHDKRLYRKTGTLSLYDFSRVWFSIENENFFSLGKHSMVTDTNFVVIYCESQIDGKEGLLAVPLRDADRDRQFAKMRYAIESSFKRKAELMTEQFVEESYGEDVLFRLGVCGLRGGG